MDDGPPDGLDALAYHERTNHSPESIRTVPGLDFDNKPTPDKRYQGLSSESLPTDPPSPDVPALEAVAVPHAEVPSDGPVPGPAPELDRTALAQLCAYAAGITKEIQVGDRTVSFRAAACTGALYHIDLYPVVGDLGDLNAGVYHFHPPSMALDTLRRGDFRGVLADATGNSRVAEAPITVVATSTWWRNAWKYRERTFRHAFWDSGTVLANLIAVAHGLGQPSEIAVGFADEDVAKLVGIDPTDEAPLELVPIGSGAPAPPPEPVEPIAPETAPLSPDPQEYPAIYRAWQAGTLDDGEQATGWTEQARSHGPVGVRDPGDGDRVSLRPVDRETASSRPLGNTIRRRGSCREYRQESISDRKLATVLDRAVRGTPLDVRPSNTDEDGSAPPLSFTDLYLIVHAIDDIPAGVYRYHPAPNELELIRSGTFRHEATDLALGQRLAGDAAACLYWMTDIEAVVGALGDRGYRSCQFEAALTAGRLYLATYAHRDLGGTGLTFFDDRVADFLSPPAEGQTPMFLYTLGRPA